MNFPKRDELVVRVVTHANSELIPALYQYAVRYDLLQFGRHRVSYPVYLHSGEDALDKYFQSELALADLEELEMHLNKLAAPGYQFGVRAEDPQAYGFWRKETLLVV